ncbi:MAG: PaaI family thioesterase [Proteobacteria bacterium]|nr:PaaI family thioesterase [Pseudomonadota bacterium]
MSPSPFFRHYRELRRRGELEAFNALIPYAAVVGFEIEETAEGPVTLLRPRPSNVGNTQIPAVHGGVVGALLEHAGMMRILWECEVDRFPKIVNISLDYLRPCLAALEARAKAVLVKQGRSVTNVRMEAWQQDPAKPVAAAHAHFLMG